MIAVLRQIVRVLALHVLDAVSLLFAIWAVDALMTRPAATGDATVWLIAISLLALNTQSAYRPGPTRRDLHRIAAGMVLAAALVLLTPLLTGAAIMSALAVAVFAAIGIAAIALERTGVDYLVRKLYARGIGLRRAVLVAPRDAAGPIMRDLDDPESADQQVLGYLTPAPTGDPEALGSVEDLATVIDELDVQEVLLTWPVAGELVDRITEACFVRGVAVLVLPWARERLHGWAEPVRIGSSVAYHLHPSRLRMPVLVVKRMGDIVFTSLGLVLALPLMGLIALAIKLDSPGPVFFRQRRVGVGGREFMMWKFRSMVAGSDLRHDDVAHLNQYPNRNLFKLRNDPRITRVGKFLRRFSLDELPQLFNILHGDMSLVGPRPPLPSEVANYEPHHFIRLSVVPGLTGPWQVGGRNLIADFEDVVRLERRYIEEWTLSRDAKILLRTIGVVLSGKGAY